MGVAFPASIARERHLHERAIQTVLHVALENALLDQDRPVRRGPLIVQIERAASGRNRSIIHDRTQFGGDPLPDPA